MSEPESIEKQLEYHRQNFTILEEQAAAFGSLYVPPYLVTNIQETKKKIEDLSSAPTSGSVQDYLRALKYSFEESINILVKPVDLDTQPGTRSPETVMTPQQRKRQARYRAEQEIQPHYVPSPDPKAEKTSVEEFLVKNSQVVLLGSPGAGKSTTLRQLALRWLEPEQLPKELRAKTPIFAALNAWDKSLSLEQFLTKQLTEVGGAELAERLSNLLKGGKALLLLDGLNELTGGIERDQKTNEIIDKRVKEIKELCQIKNLACLLSCRVKDFGEATNWHDLHVLPLEREQIERIAAAFFLGEGLKQGFIHELYEKKREENRQTKLLEMVGQPYYLLHVLDYYKAKLNLPDSPALALHYSVEATLEKLPPEQADELKERLSLLAFNMTEAGQVGAEINLAAGWLFHLRKRQKGWEREPEPKAILLEPRQARMLLNQAEGVYLISEMDGRVQFRHQLL